MAIYTVHSNSNDFKLLREGSSTFALVAPPIWLAVNRLWLELFAYCVVMGIFFFLAYKLQSGFAFLATGWPGLYLWLEGTQLVRSNLERNNWQLTDLVEAGNFIAAEAKYLARNTISSNRAPTIPSQKMGRTEKPSPKQFHHTGLFPE